ncbi:hypothetical protein L1987_05939 [Smallanthus sonchifolius]|uniref:Uncharacterized protein n=1 Tax=Smallanthus sonchifolius TaxID=185202 RepID=A0ACB9JX57_9ASTR|nr:hypothetical protein L1987_05939 [Smallanthus sonchifolius]
MKKGLSILTWIDEEYPTRNKYLQDFEGEYPHNKPKNASLKFQVYFYKSKTKDLGFQDLTRVPSGRWECENESALPSAVVRIERAMQPISWLNAELGGKATGGADTDRMRVSGRVQALMVLGFRSHASGESRGSLNVDGNRDFDEKGSKRLPAGFEPVMGSWGWEFGQLARQVGKILDITVSPTLGNFVPKLK